MDLILAIFWVVIGGAILIFGGELLVRGATLWGQILRISPLVVGLTIVAACTSAPELAVSLTGLLNEGSPDIPVGSVVGSNICNILLILGATAVIYPIAVSGKMIRREIPFLILVSVLIWGIGWFYLGDFSVPAETAQNTVSAVQNTAETVQNAGTNATVSALTDSASTVTDSLKLHYLPRWAGILFLLMLLIYTIWTVVSVRKEGNEKIAERLLESTKINTVQKTEQSAQLSNENNKSNLKKSVWTIPLALIFPLAGLGMLVYGSDRFVEGAVSIATTIGVSKLIISLTVLSIGTSLPELVVSLVAAIKKDTDMALGNIVGSNIFNILGILGVSVLTVSVPTSSSWIQTGLSLSNDAFWISIPIMIFTACLGSYLCITDKKLTRKEGVLLLLAYIGYVYYLFWNGTAA